VAHVLRSLDDAAKTTRDLVKIFAFRDGKIKVETNLGGFDGQSLARAIAESAGTKTQELN
jgi:hypothetical protein